MSGEVLFRINEDRTEIAEVEFKIVRDRIASGWVNGDPMNEAELALWRSLIGDDRIFERLAEVEEPDGMALAKGRIELEMESA